MPLIKHSTYEPPFGFRNGHVQTIWSATFRRVSGLSFERERIETPDEDFLDLDWSYAEDKHSKRGPRRLAILSHGLEGHSQRAYMRGMARMLNRANWDALAWNFRGCSGEMNRKIHSYHSGFTEDLQTVIDHVLKSYSYEEIILIGFSVGGNISLKYLGERGKKTPDVIKKCVAFSVPCDLRSSAFKMNHPANKIYLSRFLYYLRHKIRAKARRYPRDIDIRGLNRIRDFLEFDNRYTAPLNGFRDALHYWQEASSKPLLMNITIPTLLIQSRDDSILTPECFPLEAARHNSNLSLEMPFRGGHVGYVAVNSRRQYWSETRVLSFLKGLDHGSSIPSEKPIFPSQIP